MDPYTNKPNIIYAHVFDWPGDGRLLIDGEVRIKHAFLLTDTEAKLNFEETESTIFLPETAPDSIAAVIKIEL